jgi:hypothetical protein
MKTFFKALVTVLTLTLSIASCGSDDGGGGSVNPNAGSTTPSPRLGAPACEESGEQACNNHSTLFAVAHSFTDPENTVLYRVDVPAWDLGRDWQDGRNGLFYRATVSSDATICVDPTDIGSCASTKVYVPFNGVQIAGATEEPLLPDFSFIVSITGQTSGTTLTIDACFTDYQGSSFDAEPPCTDLGWTNVYESLPTPTVGLPCTDPSNCNDISSSTVAQLVDTTTASIPNTGVYPGVLLVRPSSTTLTDVGLQFFYDHLVFLDENGNPYTNDIFDARSTEHRSMGVLTIDEAAYPVSDTEYRTKYGDMQTLQGVSLPDKQFFFYTADEIASTAIRVGIAYIYDAPDGCNGHVSGVGSNDTNCDAFLTATSDGAGAGLPAFGTAASITPLDNVGNAIQPSQENQLAAGDRENRTILFESSGGGTCPRVVNPLATPLGGGFYGMPNYVIRRTIDDSRAWGRDFANALYFVLPTAFGNCDVADAPFCELTGGATSYDAYVPHYLNTAGTSAETLNGGSTSAAVVGGFTLADQYALGNAGEASSNSIVYFDNCGYGYIYTEGSGSGVALGTRKTLPDPPDDRDTYTYRITNDLNFPIVFGKECCASFYQENMDEFGNTFLEPPVELDDRFGAFIGAGDTVSYDTLFNDEAIVIYDATSGERLGKLRLNEAGGALYSCNDSSLAVRVSATSDVIFDIGVGTDDASALKCSAIGTCPFGTQAGLEEGKISCTLSTTSFLLGLPDWAEELGSSFTTIQFRAWGGDGATSADVGGIGGFAATAKSSGELTGDLYAYVGRSHVGETGAGGSSTVLTTTPLSSLSDPANVMCDPTQKGGVLLIAGGGGGGGSLGGGGFAGGDGGVAIASTTDKASATGQQGESGGGHGGNQDKCGSGSGSGTDGIGGYGGRGETWQTAGSLVPPANWSAGEGEGGTAGAGGGGFGGGQQGSFGDDGGGGGGSWAAQATASADFPDPSSPPLSPNGIDGAVQLLYDDSGTNGSATCSTESIDGRVDGVCTLTVPGDHVDLTQLPAVVGADPSSIIWIQAWGGLGGKGKGYDAEPGGDHGPAGFAQTITTIADFQSLFGTTTLYYYLGGQDKSGHNAGKGGASTIVASQDLTNHAPQVGGGGNVALIAGGGGGGSHAQPVHSGHGGGAGGVAIATTSSHASGCGGNGGSGGGSGSHGDGGCDGVGGDGGGSATGHNGHDGIGGYGGPVHAGGNLTSTQGYVNKDPDLGGNGQGGDGGDGNGGTGGGGGGGYGGGGGGNGGDSTYAGGGGGGGGSWAKRATQDDSRAPTTRPDPPTNDGVVRIVFPDLQ